MSVGECEDDLQTALPALLSRLHAGEATALHITHDVDAQGVCRFTIEVIQPDGVTTRGQPWEYRWP